MAGIILMVLLFVLFIGSAVAIFWKELRWWKVLLADIVILGSYHLYVSHECGPKLRTNTMI